MGYSRADALYKVSEMQHAREVLDLCLLARCQHTVLTIGTFGWWAAFLRRPIHFLPYEPRSDKYDAGGDLVLGVEAIDVAGGGQEGTKAVEGGREGVAEGGRRGAAGNGGTEGDSIYYTGVPDSVFDEIYCKYASLYFSRHWKPFNLIFLSTRSQRVPHTISSHM